MRQLVEHVESAMGTVVSIQVVGDDGPALLARARHAMQWVHEVERTCSRFDPTSELSRLSRTVGTPVVVSSLLRQVLTLACATASASEGAFDPTVGSTPRGRWLEIEIAADSDTVILHSPMRLDLGAVAKGFAVDLVSMALHDQPDVAINAGGDLLCRGHNLLDQPWSVGIRNPFAPGQLLMQLAVDGLAVCTSGSYERRLAAGGHHLIDPAHGSSALGLVSCTVAGEHAAIADALATAAFIMGPQRGLAFLAEQQVDALLVDAAGQWYPVHAGHRLRFPDRGEAHASPLPSA